MSKDGFEKQRDALRRELKRKCKGKSFMVVCPFLNNDVPKYLKWLEQQEKQF